MEDLHTGGRTSESAELLTLDRLFELLSDERRRYVVTYLEEATTPVAVADLAGRIADRESDQFSTAAPDHREAVCHSLYHCHLPKLADADVVAHDRDRNTVEPAVNFGTVVDLWNSLSEVEDSGSK